MLIELNNPDDITHYRAMQADEEREKQRVRDAEIRQKWAQARRKALGIAAAPTTPRAERQVISLRPVVTKEVRKDAPQPISRRELAAVAGGLLLLLAAGGTLVISKLSSGQNEGITPIQMRPITPPISETYYEPPERPLLEQVIGLNRDDLMGGN